MAIVNPSAGGKAPEIEDGIYTVICLSVEERTVTDDQYGNPDKLIFRLKIQDQLDAEGEDIILDPRINKKRSEMYSLFTYARAFGLDVDPNATVDTDDFVGLEAVVRIETEKEGSWPKIKDLSPVKKGKAAPKANSNAKSAAPDGDLLTAFWTRVRAIGLEPTNIAPLVDNDLRAP